MATMTWTPYSMDEFEQLLTAEQSDFSADENAKFARTKVPVREVRCFRSEQHPDGHLFVVASDGKTAVVFDDVEQEFAICKAQALDDDVVRDWGLAGSLVFALMHLK
jgi:hypothetical protein